MLQKTFKNISIDKISTIIDFVKPLIKPQMIIGLSGCLGAGKTFLTSALFSELGLDVHMLSPTFTIMNQYYLEKLDCVLNHFDVYRIDGISDLEAVGFFDAINDSKSITIIEWVEKINDALPPENIIFIKINISNENIENRDYDILSI